MLEAFITSKTRIKLMLKFFLNSNSKGYLRGLASEFGESTNAIRLELNRFEEAGLLESSNDGQKKMFQVNTHHPLFNDMQNIMQKYVGMDQIIEKVIKHLGNPEKVFLKGDLAMGIDSPELNMIIVADKIDEDYLKNLIKKAQKIVSRSIEYVLLTPNDFNENYPYQEKLLLVWENKE
jgi:hypothetical protein